jgi:hypothetical protein
VPSWVPDWTSEQLPKAFRRFRLSGTGEMTALYKTSQLPSLQGHIDHERELLYVEGTMLYTREDSLVPSRQTSMMRSDSIGCVVPFSGGPAIYQVFPVGRIGPHRVY